MRCLRQHLIWLTGESQDSFKLKENVFRRAQNNPESLFLGAPAESINIWGVRQPRNTGSFRFFCPLPVSDLFIPAAFSFSPFCRRSGPLGGHRPSAAARLCRWSQSVAGINSRTPSVTATHTWPPGSERHTLDMTRSENPVKHLTPVRPLRGFHHSLWTLSTSSCPLRRRRVRVCLGFNRGFYLLSHS